jgi:hypothetical protein
MTNRSLLSLGIHVATALSVVVAVMTSPMRPSRPGRGPSPPNDLRRNFALPLTHSTQRSVIAKGPESVRVRALSSEERENELEGTIGSARAFLTRHLAPPRRPVRESAAVGPVCAAHPLRC